MAAKVKIENRSPVTIHGLKPGGELMIDVDRKGTALDKHWRRRLKDADAIFVVKKKKPGGK